MPYRCVSLQGGSGAAAGLDWIQMLSGLALSFFMVMHTLFVASIILGEQTFNDLAGFFESTGLAQIGGVLIVLVFLLHFVLAARKIPFSSREQCISFKHAWRTAHPDTWMWLVQAGSGILVLLLGATHIWVLLNDLPITAEKSSGLLHEGLWLWFYLFFMFLVFVHLGAGLYRIGVKWGVILRSTRRRFKKVLFIGVLGFVFVDIISLFCLYF